MIELDIAEAATIGTRAEQQDAAAFVRFGNDSGGALLVLADGLGGHVDGAKAAQIVAATFRERASDGAFAPAQGCSRALEESIHEANARLYTAGDPADGERSMGSTAVAAVITHGRLGWISVGDSHLYAWRRGRISKLNADHSRAGMLIREGRLPGEPDVLAARSLLASALTGRTIEEIDRREADMPLAGGDVILLASDGLDVLSNRTIARLISETVEHGADAIAAALIGAVRDLGLTRQDNATVVVARILGSGAPASPEDALPPGVTRPDMGPDMGSDMGSDALAEPGSDPRWPVALGLAVIAAVVAGVILTQMP